MPRHPPIALKTLDRSHCQCPPVQSKRDCHLRNPGGIVARTRSCAEPGFNGIGTKRPASRDLSRGAVRQTHHMREIERLTATNQGHRRAVGRMSKQSGTALQPRSPNKSSLYDVIQNTRAKPKPAAKLDTNDACQSIPLNTPSEEGWWSRTGSNRRPPACKAGALPAELRPLIPVERIGGPGRT